MPEWKRESGQSRSGQAAGETAPCAASAESAKRIPSPEGLALRLLTGGDVPAMLALQEEMLAALEDPAWYFPSEEWEFTEAAQGQEAWGFFDGERLAGFAVMTPGERRGEHSYAAMLNEPVEGSFDFHDLMVAPAMRRRGIHTAFLKLFAALAAEDGGRTVYCTVDPGNGASWRNFERAGYRVVCTRPAYDGRTRRFYRLDLPQE